MEPTQPESLSTLGPTMVTPTTTTVELVEMVTTTTTTTTTITTTTTTTADNTLDENNVISGTDDLIAQIKQKEKLKLNAVLNENSVVESTINSSHEVNGNDSTININETTVDIEPNSNSNKNNNIDRGTSSSGNGTTDPLQYNYSYHVGPKIRAEKNPKKKLEHGKVQLAFPASMNASSSPMSKKSKWNHNLNTIPLIKQTHQPKQLALSLRRAQDTPIHTGDIGGSEFFQQLFTGSTSCSKILRDCFRLSSSTNMLEDDLQHTTHGNNNIMTPFDLQEHLLDHEEQLQQQQQQFRLSTSSLITEEDESSSDEEKSYLRSLKERKTLEESEKGYNRVLREKIEQANVNRMFFEPNRKKVLTKEQQQEQDFLEQNIFDPQPPPKGFIPMECTEGPYDTLYYTIHPLRLGEMKDAEGNKRNAEDIIKEGVLTPYYTKVVPYVPYNVNISRRFNQTYKNGYIIYNQINNTSHVISSHRPRKSSTSSSSHQPVLSPPLTPQQHVSNSTHEKTPNGTMTINGINLSTVHMPGYIWKKVSEIFNNINWSSEEVAIFEELIYVFGNDWSEISRIICGSKSPLQIYRMFNKQHPEYYDEDFEDDWKRVCFICFISNSLKSRGKIKKSTSPLTTCLSCERVFHIDCLDPPLAQLPKTDWYCSNDCFHSSHVKCEICAKKDREDAFILCDTCNYGYHIDCLSPPLLELPDEKWECPKCINLVPATTSTTAAIPSPIVLKIENNHHHHHNHQHQHQNTIDSMLLDDAQKLTRVTNDKENNENTIVDINTVPTTTTPNILQSPSSSSNLNQTTSIQPPLTPQSPNTQSPTMLKKSIPPHSPLSTLTSLHGLQIYHHHPITVPHLSDCPNNSALKQESTTNNIQPDSSVQEQYTSAVARVLSKEGYRLAGSAIPKPFHILKKLSQVCLGCLTQVGIFDESPHLADMNEINEYVDLLPSSMLTEQDVESEGCISRQFDTILATAPIAVSNMIDEPVLLESPFLQVNTPRRRSSNSFINSLMNGSSSVLPSPLNTPSLNSTPSSSTLESSTTPYVSSSTKKRKRLGKKDLQVEEDTITTTTSTTPPQAIGEDSNEASPIPINFLPATLINSPDTSNTTTTNSIEANINNTPIQTSDSTTPINISSPNTPLNTDINTDKNNENQQQNNNNPKEISLVSTQNAIEILNNLTDQNNNNTTTTTTTSEVNTPPSLTTSCTFEGKILLSMADAPTDNKTIDNEQDDQQDKSMIDINGIDYDQEYETEMSALQDEDVEPALLDSEATTEPTKPKRGRRKRSKVEETDPTKKKRSGISEAIGIARGRRSRLSDETASAARWWIFSGNPKNKPELNTMKTNDTMEWIVRQHADNIRKDDFVYIWVCGKYAGIAATAIALNDPQKADQTATPLYHSVKPNQHHTILLKILHLLPNIIPKRSMFDHPLLSKMTIIRAPLATNFWLTDEESKALSDLIESVNNGSLILPPIESTTPIQRRSRKSAELKNYNSKDMDDNDDDTLDSNNNNNDNNNSNNNNTTKNNIPPLPTTPNSLKKHTKHSNQPNTPPQLTQKCTLCNESSQPMIFCDSCGEFYHSKCLAEPIDKSNYAYWICFKCCMTPEDILNCKLVIGWLELRSKCKSILVHKCETFSQSHKKNIYSGNKKKVLNKMSQFTFQINSLRVQLAKLVNQRYSVWYHSMINNNCISEE